MESLDIDKEHKHFDLRRPHVLYTGPKGEKTISQNGFVYSYSIPNPKQEPWKGGRIIGKIDSMKAGVIALGHKFCDFCGYSFGLAEGLEQHLHEVHRDALMVSMLNNRKEDLKLGELPTEDQLQAEATRIVQGEEAKELLEKKEKERTPDQVAHDKNKAKKKGAYREPVGA